MISFFPFAKYQVAGQSMQPTLVKGNKILVYKWGKIREGDIVVCSISSRKYIKRVVKIERKDYFLQGDNTKFSTDSRDFGPVKRKNIVGKMILKYA